jgi:hypothetical protein
MNLMHNASVELPSARSFPLPTPGFYLVDPPPSHFPLGFFSPLIPPVPLLYIINFSPRAGPPPPALLPSLVTHYFTGLSLPHPPKPPSQTDGLTEFDYFQNVIMRVPVKRSRQRCFFLWPILQQNAFTTKRRVTNRWIGLSELIY